MDTGYAQALDVGRILGVLRRRAWLIAFCAMLGALGMYIVSSRQTSLYSSTAQILVTNPASESIFDSGGNAYSDPERQVATQAELITSPQVEAAVAEELGERVHLVTDIEVSGALDKDLIDITATSSIPEVARDAANAYANTYVLQRKSTVTETFDQRATDLREQSSKLDGDLREVQAAIATAAPDDLPALQAEAASLTRQIEDFNSRAAQLEAEAAIRTGNVEVAGDAQLPTTPFSPTTKRNAAAAAAVSLLLAVGLVLLFDRLDDRIRSPEQAESATGLPILGSIPIYAPKRKRNPNRLPHDERTLVPLASVHAEAYRTLRTSLRFSKLGKGAQVVMVTSPSGSEGKSTVSANLAVALAESGQRVVVISADLRRPMLSSILGMADQGDGLANILIGESRPTDCLVPIPLEHGSHLWLLPAGPLPPNPAELLGSPSMESLLDQLRKAGIDIILIDCPPILPVADSLAIAQFVDGVVLLAVPGHTRSHSLEEATDRLRRVGAPLIGLVLNGVPLAGGRYSYYYYRHYGYSPTAPPPHSDTEPKEDRRIGPHHSTK